MHQRLCREIGVHNLTSDYADAKDDLIGYIGNADVDRVLDTVEMCCLAIAYLRDEVRSDGLKRKGIKAEPAQALDEINHRFRAADVGYQFEDNQIIRFDSTFVHTEIVKPALRLLSDPRFAGADEEFRDAHRHYRNGDNKEAIAAANKAFESTMKCACDIKKWEYDKNARASDLVKVLQKNGLWPDYLEKPVEQLLATLKNGLPEVRNKNAGHGQGATPREAPDLIAAYAMNLAATNILLVAMAAT